MFSQGFKQFSNTGPTQSSRGKGELSIFLLQIRARTNLRQFRSFTDKHNFQMQIISVAHSRGTCLKARKWQDRKGTEKSPAPTKIQTHGLVIVRHELYRCAITYQTSSMLLKIRLDISLSWFESPSLLKMFLELEKNSKNIFRPSTNGLPCVKSSSWFGPWNKFISPFRDVERVPSRTSERTHRRRHHRFRDRAGRSSGDGPRNDRYLKWNKTGPIFSL